MAEKEIIGQYNQTIADASNSIGQKLFAYIANGKNINDRIRDKFKKSLIFIGDEGQIYNPLTNTYVGIGQTAYTQTISYIEEAHEKINALQKMLASSMVSAIYANWYKTEWDKTVAEGDRDKLPSKIYATNEIVLKGHGDYDPVTHLAATREYAHITDANADDELQAILNKTYKSVKGASDTDSAFATSGITVSLQKGENRYLYSYIYTNRQNIDGVGEAPDIEPYAKEQKIYLTDEEYDSFLTSHLGEDYLTGSYICTSIIDYDTLDATGKPTDIYYHDGTNNNYSAYVIINFFNGLKPQYGDGFEVTGNREADKIGQLFKQGTNVLTIDDKLTWSYIASAYTYTVNFARDYTDKQVQRIYRELLGEDSALIPVSWDQVRVSVPNDEAALNRDIATWDSENGQWIYNTTDDVKETSSNLHEYVLNYSSTFVVEEERPTADELLYDEVNEVVKNGSSIYILPWTSLKTLSEALAKHKEDIIEECRTYSYAYNSTVDIYDALKNGINDLPGVDDFVNSYIFNVKGVDYKYSDLADVRFMGFDKTAASEHTDESFNREISFEESRGDKSQGYDTEAGRPKTDENGLGGYAAEDRGITSEPGDPTAEPPVPPTYVDYGFAGTKYNLPKVYKVLSFEESIATDEYGFVRTNAVYAVNTSHINNGSINLADGIQTLKEVAYILDVITDGWGNQYDPEGNGILLTYTIANNHERIEDHERRLRDLEGGTNIVKAIYKDRNSMSKYVNLHLKSDTSWIAKGYSNLIVDTVSTDDIFGEGKYLSESGGNYTFTKTNVLDESADWWGKFTFDTDPTPSQYILTIPKSYICAYNMQLNAYWAHIAKIKNGNHIGSDENVESLPSFIDFYDKTVEFNFGDAGSGKLISVDDFVIPQYNEDSKVTYFKDAAGNVIATGEFANIAAYTGQVGIGIDLNVATTFTSYLYCDDDITGYEQIDLNSAEVKKSMVLKLLLPSVIAAYNGIDGFSDENGVISETPAVDDKMFRFTIAEANALNGLKLDDAFAVAGHAEGEYLLDRYKDEIDAFVSNFKGVARENIVVEASINNDTDSNTSGIALSAEFTIVDTENAIDKDEYRTELYSAPKVLATYTYTPEGEANPVTENKLKFTDSDLFNSANVKYYVRKAPVQGVTPEMKDALTNVDWVSAYVGHTVSIVSEQIKGIQTDAYQFSKSLIESLDSSYVSAYGYFIAGIKQENGIVKPIIRELPKDTISAGVEVWGETNSYVFDSTDVLRKQYDKVVKEDLTEQEIGAYTALFMENGYDYLPISAKNISGIAIEGINIGGVTYIQAALNPTDTNTYSTIYSKTDNGFETVVDNDFNKVNVKCSILAGELYNGFTQYYFRESAYVMIDPADIKINYNGGAYTYSYALGGANLTIAFDGDAKIDDSYAYLYKLASSQPVDQKKYITAESFYQAENSNGVGGNAMKVTAHLTKISDASESNSGLVDAYDVRNTLDNLFEWIDLSRWDEGTNNTNPVNTEANEAGGDVEMKQRIIDAKNSGKQLGYPVSPSRPTEEPTAEP